MTCLACGSVGAVSGFAVSAMLPRKREKSEGWSGILSEMARILVELRWQSGYMGIFDWKDMEEDCVVSNEYMMAPSAIHIEPTAGLGIGFSVFRSAPLLQRYGP